MLLLYKNSPSRDRSRNHRLARARPLHPTRQVPADALLAGVLGGVPAGALGHVRAGVLVGALSGVPAEELRVAEEGLKVSEREQEPGKEGQRAQEGQTGEGAQRSGLPRQASPSCLSCLLPSDRHGRTSPSKPGLLGRRKPRSRHVTRRSTKGYSSHKKL